MTKIYDMSDYRGWAADQVRRASERPSSCLEDLQALENQLFAAREGMREIAADLALWGRNNPEVKPAIEAMTQTLVYIAEAVIGSIVTVNAAGLVRATQGGSHDQPHPPTQAREVMP